jgi:hypothetical protein
MNRFWLVSISIIIVAVAIVGVLVWRKPFIPGKIKGSVTSTIFVPAGPQVKNQSATVKYDSSLKLLSYQSIAYGVNTTVSEQPTPQNFIDIPEVYDKVVTSYNQYENFDTAAGTVYLTRPKNQNGRQVAVMNSKGTLMFVKADRDLSDDQWRKFFNNLQIVK